MALARFGITLTMSEFLSTPSARRATGGCAVHPHRLIISIHALREEGDCKTRGHLPLLVYFYPRPPRGGRRCWLSICRAKCRISIHALREEGD